MVATSANLKVIKQGSKGRTPRGVANDIARKAKKTVSYEQFMAMTRKQARDADAAGHDDGTNKRNMNAARKIHYIRKVHGTRDKPPKHMKK